MVSTESEYVKAAFLAQDPMLEVKKSYAEKMEKDAIRDLVLERRGILILDLDHTLFQVTMRPITTEFRGIETWNFQTELTHSGTLLEGKTYWFTLDSSPRGTAPFFLHLRPGLFSFLETASKMFELYAYTQGTTEYAKKILTGIDPKGKWFGNSRLIARELDPHTGRTIPKTLARVFPSEEDLVLIIDDRDDVWDKKAGQFNLIKLLPFLYFPDPEREKMMNGWPSGARLSSSDQQLKYLEHLLNDVHSEAFFGNTQTTISQTLYSRKRLLFSNMYFASNEQVSKNIFRLITDFGGKILHNEHKFGVVNIHIGVPGQGGQGEGPEWIHPWFILFSISTLTVPSDPSLFSIHRIANENIQTMWECVHETAGEESDLLADLLA